MSDENSQDQFNDADTVVFDAKPLGSLSLFIIPRGKNAKPEYVAAVDAEVAYAGAVWFLGDRPKPIVAEPTSLPAIGSRIIKQVPERISQEGHSGFICVDCDLELLEELGLRNPKQA